jgi:hypothetical protein
MSTASHYESAILNSIDYLSSPEALKSVDLNPYWPKWNSPWWHVSLLFEMGMADRIPGKLARHLLDEVKRTHLPYFFREDAPAGKGSDQDAPCPCALGNIYQIFSAAGLDVDHALPWARGWFLKYQMPDGGLNCDEDAYKAGEVNASSFVGTIAPLEAILFTRDIFTPEEEAFLDRGANGLLKRELRFGSQSNYNAGEKGDEEDWLKLCFPRFYFYDVLRGLRFIVKWSEKRKKPFPAQTTEFVSSYLNSAFPDETVRVGRQCFEGVSDRKKPPATFFPLLLEVSRVGEISPFLSAEWSRVRYGCLIQKSVSSTELAE